MVRQSPSYHPFCDVRHAFTRINGASHHVISAKIGAGRMVAVLSPLRHHRFVVPETELVPEIRKTGHRMADLAVAFSALFVSLCSIGIPLPHGRTMQTLVEAISGPFIQTTTSGDHPAADSTLSRVFTVLISNPGAGAARVERFS